jgi:uridine kinase
MSSIIGISGAVGAGKTSLAAELAARLGDAAVLSCDSYERISEQPPERIIAWMERGADYDELLIPQVADDLAALKRGEAVVEPLRQTTIKPAKHILFETNFGRAHRPLGQHIDLLIWIDTPLEIALARKIQEYVGVFLAKHKPERYGDDLAWLHEWLTNYLRFTRRLLRMQRERVRPGADVVLDGEQDQAGLIEQALREIERRFTSVASVAVTRKNGISSGTVCTFTSRNPIASRCSW